MSASSRASRQGGRHPRHRLYAAAHRGLHGAQRGRHPEEGVRALATDKGVHILDPFVGTGNFIIRVMQQIKTSALPYKYENELHCNEVMLLPYYIASMNIEHEYLERRASTRHFPGICLVDTFDMRAQAATCSLRKT